MPLKRVLKYKVAESTFTFEGKKVTLIDLTKMLEDNKIWPAEMKERYSRRVVVGGPECRSFDNCRDNQEMKDSAYCFASKQIDKIVPTITREDLLRANEDNKNAKVVDALPSGIDPKSIFAQEEIYYAETQKKTGSPNDYGQFLFAKLPRDYLSFYNLIKAGDSQIKTQYKPFLFTFIFLNQNLRSNQCE